MSGFGFLRFKLDYEQTQHLAIGDVVSSKNFSAGDYMWKINCYPRGVDIDGKNEHLSLYVQLVSKSKNVKALFNAMMLDRDGDLSSSDERKGVEVHLSEGGIQWGWSRFIKRSDLLPFVMNGMVTIMCMVKVLGDSNMPVPPPSTLATHLGHLLDRTLGTDVSFIVGGEAFPAHRSLLAARSPVFCAELFGSMADATMPSITLQDIDPAAFRVMLRFIYTDALPPDDEFGDSPVEVMLHLLAAADRYALERLKVMCELKLWENLSVDTAASVLASAETYSCPKLKTKCMEFFAVKENFKKAALTDGFVMLLQNFPALADELLGRVLGV
ncbi:unnamed protein product [Urochloa decumbens]|uniref:Uncharacterized protein n=1 Tax=Urochloa decumbens TaxID=240449 RepID=A0ABC9C529_9POAL